MPWVSQSQYRFVRGICHWVRDHVVFYRVPHCKEIFSRLLGDLVSQKPSPIFTDVFVTNLCCHRDFPLGGQLSESVQVLNCCPLVTWPWCRRCPLAKAFTSWQCLSKQAPGWWELWTAQSVRRARTAGSQSLCLRRALCFSSSWPTTRRIEPVTISGSKRVNRN